MGGFRKRSVAKLRRRKRSFYRRRRKIPGLAVEVFLGGPFLF
jgi:hypothetical protein